MGSALGGFWCRIDRSSRFGHQSWFDMPRTTAVRLTFPAIGHLLSASMVYSHRGLRGLAIASCVRAVQSIKFVGIIDFLADPETRPRVRRRWSCSAVTILSLSYTRHLSGAHDGHASLSS